MDSGKVDLGMEKVFRNGQMVPYTKVNGRTTEPMVRENSLILTVISTRDNG